jgi:hypothetical protein
MFVINYANVDHTIVASVSVHVISPKHARIRLRLSEWIGVVVIHTLTLTKRRNISTPIPIRALACVHM